MPEDEPEAKDGQVIYPRQISRYTRSSQDRIPVAKKREIRRDGPFGIYENAQDKAHVANQQGLEDKALETDTMLGYHAAIEYRQANRAIKTVDAIEQDLVFITKPGTVAGAFAEDMLVDSANRLRATTDEGIKLYINEATEIIRND